MTIDEIKKWMLESSGFPVTQANAEYLERFQAIAFKAGIASRDAEVARLKTVPMRYRRMAFNAQLQDEVARLEQENDQLCAQINVLREAMGLLEKYVSYNGDTWVQKEARNALATTPEQSLAEYRNKVIEDCAVLCEKSDRYRGAYFAEKLRAMKEQP